VSDEITLPGNKMERPETGDEVKKRGRPKRQSISEEVLERKESDNPKAVRADMQQKRNLDADYYVQRYPDMQLMWINDIGGEVQRWIDAGAEPVQVENRSGRTFAGITDKHESEWVRAVGGDDGMGNHFWVYLLMIDREEYNRIKLDPVKKRQLDIQNALYSGHDQSDSRSGLKSYAPELPTGDIGMSVSRE
jgi:hypothetical protein